MNLRIIDVSMPIHMDMQVYKNKAEKRPSFTTTSDFDETGEGAHETRICIDAHTGTHVDAPLHMVPGGATIESLSLSRLASPCRVLDLTAVDDAVHAADLEPFHPAAGEFLLLKTKNSFEDAFNFSFVYVAKDAAEFLAQRRIAGLAVDGLGVERAQSGHPTHKALFAKDIVIVEGLRLAHVDPGEYLFIAATLPVTGIDAAPARAFLLLP